MKYQIIFYCFFLSVTIYGQNDTPALEKLGKETVLSEVVIRSDLNVLNFLKRVKDDTSFYKAFRNLHIIEYTSLNDIKMVNREHAVVASLYSKTRQKRENGCRMMEILEEKRTGNIYDGDRLNYYTAELYAGLFFTKDKVCNENNIVKGMDL